MKHLFSLIICVVLGVFLWSIFKPEDKLSIDDLTLCNKDLIREPWKKALEDFEAWGARNPNFDKDGRLIFFAEKANENDSPNPFGEKIRISGDPDIYAKQIYVQFKDVPGITGVIIFDLNGKEMGKYLKDE